MIKNMPLSVKITLGVLLAANAVVWTLVLVTR